MNQIFQEMNQNKVANALGNPQIKQVLDLVRNSGKNPKDLFYQKAKEMGVDPNSILNQLR